MVRFHWRPTLAFYERRYGLLRQLEDAKLVRDFRVRENAVSVRLGDPYHFITLRPDGVSFGMLGPTTDRARLETALEQVLEAMAPDRLSRPSFGLQWVEPHDGDYDELRQAAVTNLFGDGPSEYMDSALLVEGRTAEPDGSYGLEVGVVEAAELPLRLSREQGRIGTPESEGPPTLWTPDMLPDVALFCDSEWTLVEQIKEPSVGAAVELWDRATTCASAVVSAIYGRLLPSQR
jgi:hypothetical protein